MNKYMTATKARAKFFDVIDTKPGVSVFIMLEGQPKAVVMSYDDYEGWMETFEVMADPELSKDVLAGLREMRSGKITDTIDFETYVRKRTIRDQHVSHRTQKNGPKRSGSAPTKTMGTRPVGHRHTQRKSLQREAIAR